ncbi:RNB domain-containing ribonuclease [bacterium]|nr:RNB domain-containing ribonuclease [bacterium]
MKKFDLKQLADLAMLDRGLDPSYSALARQQAERARLPPIPEQAVDLRHLPWCSIDNGEGEEVSSKDLDQITVAQPAPNGNFTVYVAIADVDVLVPLNCPIDEQARRNTTTVYTAEKNYPMIHPRLSEGLTSLNQDEDRLAMVNQLTVTSTGEVADFRFFQGLVRNHLKLNYESVGQWLEGEGAPPARLQGKEEMIASLQLQDQVAQILKERRRRLGSLELESLEARAQIDQDRVVRILPQLRNHATELIENLMVASNGCASRFLNSQGYPSLQRVVRQPKFWDEIVALAADKGWDLPPAPDSGGLARFLDSQRHQDALHFPDLSLSILKLLGRGEYVVELPGQPPIGHFGLAVRDYSHATAPNRRYPDLITQRLLKAALRQQACPYPEEELEKLARHCTQQEGQAQKVERQSQKSAAALMLSQRLGETFEAVVSGQNRTTSWVRLLTMPIEGKLIGSAKLGQRLRVKLAAVNVGSGFIDFRAAP